MHRGLLSVLELIAYLSPLPCEPMSGASPWPGVAKCAPRSLGTPGTCQEENQLPVKVTPF
jgi:hypothetical protein